MATMWVAVAVELVELVGAGVTESYESSDMWDNVSARTGVDQTGVTRVGRLL